MKRHFILVLCLFFSVLLLLLCACRQTTSDAPTDPTVTASVPETASVGTTPETTISPDTDTDGLLTTTQPPAPSLDGTLYEYRNNFSETFLPTAPEKVLGGRLVYSEEEGEFPNVKIECEGKEYEMKYSSSVCREEANGSLTPLYRAYAERAITLIGANSSATLDLSGRIVEMSLVGTFLPEDFTEADLLQVAMRIAAQIYPIDPETLICEVYSGVLGDEGLEMEEGYRKDEDVRYYKVSYARYIGSVRTGEYIELTFNPFYSSIASLKVSASYMDAVDPDSYAGLTLNDAMGCIRQSFPTLGLEGARVDYRFDTLVFTEINGAPCLTVECVVTLGDGMQYETSLCYCFKEA